MRARPVRHPLPYRGHIPAPVVQQLAALEEVRRRLLAHPQYAEYHAVLTPDFLSRVRLEVDTRLARLVLRTVALGRHVGGVVPAAVALGPLVCVDAAFYAPDTPAGLALLAHEAVHVWQWRQRGLLPFAWSYLREFLAVGYEAISYERAAATVEQWVREAVEKGRFAGA